MITAHYLSNEPQDVAKVEICVLIPVDTLQDIRAWVMHWERDKQSNCAPTDQSLNTVRDLLRSALDRPRVFAALGYSIGGAA